MKNQKWILFAVALALMAGGAALLERLKSHPRLGRPGITAETMTNSVQMKIGLPENVSYYTSTNVPEPALVLGYLPPDTSYAERMYLAPDGFWVQATLILMGADRTSIHNADFCLRGQGWVPISKSIAEIPITGTQPYSLPVSEWKVNGTFRQPDGKQVTTGGVCVFWFVADGDETPSHFDMMKKLALHLLKTGVMERWAYVSYFAPCAPGREDKTFARMKRLIAASVPEFQPPPTQR
ncbi:MAG TPA: hypothetical protein VMB22_03775 [Verrucomicrobiae bacterium]|nr:hypothetical protein [Verrucomicrobiae bacterium]